MTSTKSCSTLTTYCINFIHEYNGWGILLSLCEQIANTRSTHTYKHFYKLRTGYIKEWYSSFTGNCLSQQGLTSSWRTYQQNSLWNFCSKGSELSWILQKFNNFYQFLLCLLSTSYILKGNSILTTH